MMVMAISNKYLNCHKKRCRDSMMDEGWCKAALQDPSKMRRSS